MNYLFKPKDINEFNGRIKYFLYCLAYCYLISFILFLLGEIFLNIYNQFTDKTTSYKDVYKWLFDFRQYSFIEVVVLGPLTEELMFRLGLLLRKTQFIFSVFCWEFYLFNGSNLQFNLNLKESLLLGVIYFFSFCLIHRYQKNIFENAVFSKNYLVWVSLIGFTLMHLINFKNFINIPVSLVVIYLIPKLIIGYFITILRLSFGFIWGLFFHITINLISFII